MGVGMVAKLKAAFRSLVPSVVLRQWARLKNQRTTSNADVRAIFTDIYKSNRWGGEAGEFFSGSGSDAATACDFVDTVNAFIAENGVRSVVDLGCGDFRVGSRIAGPGLDYTGIDIVEDLIARNNNAFGGEGVRFVCLNIIEDALPEAELCLVRQVLQHLSNDQIAKILQKISRYPFAIIAEHHPDPARFVGPNLDKAVGSDVRVYSDSGVYPDHPPFSLEGVEVLCRTAPSKWLLSSDEAITTYLVRNKKWEN